MRLQARFTVAMAILLIFTIFTVTGISFYLTTKITEGNAIKLNENKLNEAVLFMKNKEAEVNIIKSDINKQSIIKAKTFAYMLQQNPGMLDFVEEIDKVAKTLDVDEVHICDENGVLRWGNIPDFFGFDFSTTEQTKPFMEALTNKAYEFAQDPSERGVDNKLFQYISVARQDRSGIVQVGIRPERLEQALASADIANVGQSMLYGKDGYVFIVDKQSYAVMSHKDSSRIGEDIRKYEFYSSMKDKKEGNTVYTIGGVKKYLSFIATDRYIICATVPASEFTEGLGKLLRDSIIVSVISLLLTLLLISLLVKYNVVSEINKLLVLVKSIGSGDLTLSAEVNSSKEFKELSSGINNMKDSIKEIIKNITQTSKLVYDASTKLNGSAEYTNKGAEEIAVTVNELAKSSNDQAGSAIKGAELAKKALGNLQEIESVIEETVASTDSAKNSVQKGMKAVKYQSEKMEQNVSGSQAVNEAVIELSEKADEIGTIINVISSIANQTNMLALNAAIEAARAGEAGRGFAVVSDEVRKLAESSTESSGKIASIITEIQECISNVRSQAEESVRMVKEQKASVLETQNAFEEIIESANHTVQQVSMIYSSTNAIVKAVKDITLVMENTAAAAQQNASGTEEISASTQEQAAAVEEIIRIAGDLNKMVSYLREITGRFIV